MKKLTHSLKHLLVIMALILPWATTEALETFEKAGIISGLGYDKFTVDYQDYRISPSAKLESDNADRRKFSDFEKGDHIWFKGIILDGVHYVEIIVYETPSPS